MVAVDGQTTLVDVRDFSSSCLLGPYLDIMQLIGDRTRRLVFVRDANKVCGREDVRIISDVIIVQLANCYKISYLR